MIVDNYNANYVHINAKHAINLVVYLVTQIISEF